MKSLSKLAATASGLTVLALAAFSMSPVLADSPGQIVGGTIFQIQNLTQKAGFANPATANACDELEYSVQLANAGYGDIYNTTVSVSLPSTSSASNTATMTATGQSGEPATTTTTASATLNISSAQTVSYVNGSTQLLDQKGNVIETLPDGVITSSGVNIGTLIGSATEYVNFEAKVSCPPATTPAQPVYTCNLLSLTEPATKQIQASVQYTAQNGATFENVTYNFGDNSTPLTTTSTSTTYTYANYGTYNVTATVAFNVNGTTESATSTNCAKSVSFAAPTTPPTLVNTGPGDVIGLFGLTTVAGAVAHRLFGRRLARFF